MQARDLPQNGDDGPDLTPGFDTTVFRTANPGQQCRMKPEADARTRTGDPFITSEVLYQLSYVGGAETG